MRGHGLSAGIASEGGGGWDPAVAAAAAAAAISIGNTWWAVGWPESDLHASIAS